MDIDQAQAAAAREQVQRAKAVGISYVEMQTLYQGQPDALEAEIERRVNDRKGAGWKGRVAAFEIRRKRIAGAYLGGASLTQLAHLEQVSTVAIHNMLTKELDTTLRLQVASERTARGRRRAPLRTPTQVSAMLGALSDVELRDLSVLIIAARMVRVAIVEGNEDDESDPYLRGSAEAEATSHLPGQDRRGERDREESIRQERAAEGN